jgi:hypothetical protein
VPAEGSQFGTALKLDDLRTALASRREPLWPSRRGRHCTGGPSAARWAVRGHPGLWWRRRRARVAVPPPQPPAAVRTRGRGRARSHRFFARLFIHFISHLRRDSVPRFLNRQCDWTPGRGLPLRWDIRCERLRVRRVRLTV